jgi:hypothetical protein
MVMYDKKKTLKCRGCLVQRYRDICSVLLSTGLAVLENNSRELAFLANLGKLNTI